MHERTLFQRMFLLHERYKSKIVKKKRLINEKKQKKLPNEGKGNSDHTIKTNK